jgi:hypothetical protein
LGDHRRQNWGLRERAAIRGERGLTRGGHRINKSKAVKRLSMDQSLTFRPSVCARRVLSPSFTA